MKLPGHKTKIVCTIGPASRSESVLKNLIRHGMDVARLNLSHGSVEEHRENIRRIRAAAAGLKRECLILADLPGPKIRIGMLQDDPLMLEKGHTIILTTETLPGTVERISVNYDRLPAVVSKGSKIYLNDGFIQLTVLGVAGTEVRCNIEIGGPLLSHKGMNLPDAGLFMETITGQDLSLVKFGLQEGIDTFGVSFVEKADDILRLRDFAMQQGKSIHLIAKIERAEAVRNIDGILHAADAIMIARGDLGVQIPIEDIPGVQKTLILKANLHGRPVITATQMLESMTHNIRPTRAEVTDVANAILDGTDAVMLSEETAIGAYPVETVAMMTKIAASIERQRRSLRFSNRYRDYIIDHKGRKRLTIEEVIALNIIEAIQTLPVRCVITPTLGGNTPRSISRFKPACWIFALTQQAFVHNFLTLSYGVRSFQIVQQEARGPEDVVTSFKALGLVQTGDTVIFTEGVSSGQTGWTNSLRIMSI